MNAQRLSLLAVCLAALTLPALAIDWPQWRGPDRTGVSQETGLLKSWPKDGPKLLWTNRDGGQGYSSPTVVGDRLYSLGSNGKSEFVYAVNVNTGEKLWSTDISGVFVEGHGDGPRGTPAVDGEFLYALSGTSELACLETATGKKVWSKNLVKDLGGKQMSPQWGYSESPLVDGDVVICTPGNTQGALAALNKKTGEVVWRSKEVTEICGFSSPIVVDAPPELGGKQYIQQTSKGVVGISPKDGKLLWRYDESSYRQAVIPTAIYHNGSVFITSGYGSNNNLVKLVPGDKGVKAEKVYQNRNLGNHHGGVVLIGDYLYGHGDKNGWTCLDFKTGEVKWSDKTLDKGCLTAADGMLYCCGEKSNAVVLAEASPNGWKEAGRFTIPETSKLRKRGAAFWTHPVVANGKLYVRDQDLLFCYDVKAK